MKMNFHYTLKQKIEEIIAILFKKIYFKNILEL